MGRGICAGRADGWNDCPRGRFRAERLTGEMRRAFIAPMRRCRVFTALLLALLWLPATVHCGLEAAGLVEHADACGHEDHRKNDADSGHCDADNCSLVEDGAYAPSHQLVKVAAPIALLHVCHAVMRLAFETRARVVAEISPRTESPPEINRTWQFVARAALSPRAPSLVS